MFTLIISASSTQYEPFGPENTRRALELMKQFSFNKGHATRLCTGTFNGESELSVRVDNCGFAVPHIKAILQQFNQKCCMVLWEGAAMAELLYVDGRSTTAGKVQVWDAYPDTNAAQKDFTHDLAKGELLWLETE